MIPHNRWTATPEDHAAVKRVLDSGHVGQGPETEAFEREFAERFGGGREAVAVSSGTVALYLALKAEGVWTGDRVLVPTYACSALYNAVRLTGAEVELGDVLPESFNLDPAFKPRHKCKATIYVHTYGVPGQVPDGVTISDVTHAIGACYNGEPVTQMGSMSVASLGPTKLLGTPGGGVILAPPDRAAYIRDLRDYDGKDDLKDRGNWQWNDVSAAIGRVRLAALGGDLARRRDIAHRYHSMLSCSHPVQGIERSAGDGSARVWYRYVIRYDMTETAEVWLAGAQCINPLETDELLHRMLGEDKRKFPVSEDIAAHTLSLPIYPSLTDEEVGKVCEVLGRLEA